MTAVLVRLYQSPKIADKVAYELVELGCDENGIAVIDGREGESSVEDDVMQELRDSEVDPDDARGYVDAVKGGKILVVADAPDEVAEDARAVMEAYETEEAGAAGSGAERAQTVPVLQEQLRVGKRATAGLVRARRVVTERPVEETVRLRREKVDVERHPTERRLSPEEEVRAFEETTVDITETSEEAVVTKEVWVVEEVSLRKNVEEREETVRDTVRRADVEVEREQPKPPEGAT